MPHDHDPEADEQPPELLTEPRDGVPEVVADQAALDRVMAELAAGDGPVAVDAERASGFRYHPRAYLIQLRRAGAGTVLIDPVAVPELAELGDRLSEPEWILHAASQDLACLAEVGLTPRQLFDTELAARLCDFERVGLATLTEKLLGYRLEKHHSAADWSTRPLPAEWLTYAALDVELLVDLRDLLDAELRAQGKRDWAAEEFAALLDAPPPAPRPEPWRRTSGIHRVRGARRLARVRELWNARDDVARRLDRAPSKIVPDFALVEAALADPEDFGALTSVPGFQRRHGRNYAKQWLQALSRARTAAEDELPAPSPTPEGPPATHRWASRDPEAAQRLKRARAAVTAVAEKHRLPAENLISPAAVRALAWRPPRPVDATGVDEALQGHRVRDWQRRLIAAELAKALRG